MSDQTHQTKTEDGRDFVQLLRDVTPEMFGGRDDVSLLAHEAAQKLSDAFDYQENLERRQLSDSAHIAKLETSLNAALDQGIALTDKIATLEAALAAANDRTNNAEQAALQWQSLIKEGFDNLLATVPPVTADIFAGVTERVSEEGVRYMHHPDAAPAPSPILGFVP